jgi:Uncharacterised ArCR, COG2043
VVKISVNNIRNIGESIKRAGNLNTEPLAVYGSKEIPEDAVPICSIDRCVAKAIYDSAFDEEIPALYMGNDTRRCCPGARTYFGYNKPGKFIKYFVSTGNEKFMNGTAEYLKASPEIVEAFLESIGEIKPLDGYMVIQRCKDLKEDIDIESIICFGKAEQIRNMSNLIHFRTTYPFDSISMPMGPTCATLVTYPARLADKTPKEMAFVGPVDPTGNKWFPEDYMAIGIPTSIAIKMAEDLEKSFIIKRPDVAYPKIRDEIK